MTRATRSPRGTRRGRLMLSLSPAERVDLEAAATAAGLPLAAWIRDAALAAARPKTPRDVAVDLDLDSLATHAIAQGPVTPDSSRAAFARILVAHEAEQVARMRAFAANFPVRSGAIKMPMRKERDE